MIQKKREPFDPNKVTCSIDDVEVDCETWGDPVAKEEADEIESQLDFLSHFDS
jgi:hypothetical protein